MRIDPSAHSRPRISSGLLISLVFHGVLLALLLLRIVWPDVTPPKEESVNVTLTPPPQPEKTPPQAKAPSQPNKTEKARLPTPTPAPSAAPALESGAPDTRAKPDQPASTDSPPTAEPEKFASAKPQPKQDQAVKSQDKPQPQAAPSVPQDVSPPKVDRPADVAEPQREKAGTRFFKTSEQEPVPSQPHKPDVTENHDKDEDHKAPLAPLKPVKTIYSKAILSNPHVRQALGHLPVEQRIVQMCSIETLEQIRHTMPGSYPDLLVPFSTTGGRISGHVLDASGGAFRSRGQWYDISYRCESDAKVTTILSYRFQIGEPVPRGEWAARKLPAN